MTKELVIFDIDGTLADIEHRRGFVRTKPKNYKAFEAGIPNDGVHEPVKHVFKMFVVSPNYKVLLASGRSENSRDDTQIWLVEHGLVGYEGLYMRAAGDYRSDVIVKQEILDQIVEEHGQKPLFAVDDRPGVVQMWRDNGIFVFDVNQSGEDF